jgi:hypothetical protein
MQAARKNYREDENHINSRTLDRPGSPHIFIGVF